MKCVVCLWVASQSTVKATVMPATTTLQGSSMCDKHALEKMEILNVLQQVGLK